MSTGIKRVYAIFYDQSEDHICAWTDNQLEVPATYNAETESYELSTTALAVTSWYQPNHKYAVTLFAEDEAGNVGSVGSTDETYGSQLNFRVKEKIAPTVTFVSPSANSVVGETTPVIVFELIDGDESNIGSGINEASFTLTVGTQTYVFSDLVKVDGFENRYSLTPTTALAGGNVNVKIVVSDNDENQTEQQISFVVHNVGPELEVIDPSAAVTLLPNTYAEDDLYTVKVKAKPVDGSTVTKLTIVTKEIEDGDVKDTYEITTIPAADETGFIVFTQDVKLYCASKTFYTDYERLYLTITATDSYGGTTTVKRELNIDMVAPVIKDVATEATEIDATTGKIKIQFRLADSPPFNIVTATKTTNGNVPSNGASIAKTYKVGQSYTRFVDFTVAPDDVFEENSPYMTVTYTYPSGKSPETIRNLTISRKEESTPELGSYRIEYPDPIVISDNEFGYSYRETIMAIPIGKGCRLLQGNTINVVPEFTILESSISEINYNDLDSYIPSFKVKMKPDVGRITAAKLKLGSNNTLRNFGAKIEKVADESTSEYGVYTITGATKITKTILTNIIGTNFYNDVDMNQRLTLTHSYGSTTTDIEAPLSYKGIDVWITNIKIETPTVLYKPSFAVKVQPDIGAPVMFQIQWGTKAYQSIGMTATKVTSLSTDEYGVYQCVAGKEFGTSDHGIVSGTETTIAQNIRVGFEVSPTMLTAKTSTIHYTAAAATKWTMVSRGTLVGCPDEAMTVVGVPYRPTLTFKTHAGFVGKIRCVEIGFTADSTVTSTTTWESTILSETSKTVNSDKTVTYKYSATEDCSSKVKIGGLYIVQITADDSDKLHINTLYNVTTKYYPIELTLPTLNDEGVNYMITEPTSSVTNFPVTLQKYFDTITSVKLSRKVGSTTTTYDLTLDTDKSTNVRKVYDNPNIPLEYGNNIFTVTATSVYDSVTSSKVTIRRCYDIVSIDPDPDERFIRDNDVDDFIPNWNVKFVPKFDTIANVVLTNLTLKRLSDNKTVSSDEIRPFLWVEGTNLWEMNAYLEDKLSDTEFMTPILGDRSQNVEFELTAEISDGLPFVYEGNDVAYYLPLLTHTIKYTYNADSAPVFNNNGTDTYAEVKEDAQTTILSPFEPWVNFTPNDNKSDGNPYELSELYGVLYLTRNGTEIVRTTLVFESGHRVLPVAESSVSSGAGEVGVLPNFCAVSNLDLTSRGQIGDTLKFEVYVNEYSKPSLIVEETVKARVLETVTYADHDTDAVISDGVIQSSFTPDIMVYIPETSGWELSGKVYFITNGVKSNGIDLDITENIGLPSGDLPMSCVASSDCSSLATPNSTVCFEIFARSGSYQTFPNNPSLVYEAPIARIPPQITSVYPRNISSSRPYYAIPIGSADGSLISGGSTFYINENGHTDYTPSIQRQFHDETVENFDVTVGDTTTAGEKKVSTSMTFLWSRPFTILRKVTLPDSTVIEGPSTTVVKLPYIKKIEVVSGELTPDNFTSYVLKFLVETDVSDTIGYIAETSISSRFRMNLTNMTLMKFKQITNPIVTKISSDTSKTVYEITARTPLDESWKSVLIPDETVTYTFEIKSFVPNAVSTFYPEYYASTAYSSASGSNFKMSVPYSAKKNFTESVEVLSASSTYKAGVNGNSEPYYFPSITFKCLDKAENPRAFVQFPNAPYSANSTVATQIKTGWYELTEKTVDSSNAGYNLITLTTTNRFSGEVNQNNVGTNGVLPYPETWHDLDGVNAATVSNDDESIQSYVIGGYHPSFLLSGNNPQKFRIYNSDLSEYISYENTLVVT